MTLIQIGVLTMTPEQLQRALAEDMTVSQAQKMIEEDNRRSSNDSPSDHVASVD